MTESATTRKAVWFYNLELALLAEGGYHVTLTATTVDEEESQLLCQEIASERVESIGEVLALIRESVTGAA